MTVITRTKTIKNVKTILFGLSILTVDIVFNGNKEPITINTSTILEIKE